MDTTPNDACNALLDICADCGVTSDEKNGHECACGKWFCQPHFDWHECEAMLAKEGDRP